jgi:hypothetical protein
MTVERKSELLEAWARRPTLAYQVLARTQNCGESSGVRRQNLAWKPSPDQQAPTTLSDHQLTFDRLVSRKHRLRFVSLNELD